jgi:hypothetical protein
MRRKIDPRNCTAMEFAYARTGSMLKAARVVAFIVGWAVVRRELGREPTVDEYAAWWKEHRATAYRHRAEFREVFGVSTPGPILDALERQHAQLHDRIDLGQLAAA